MNVERTIHLMEDILDLDRYPLDRPGSAAWSDLVVRCQSELARDGMFNLDGLVQAGAVARAMNEVRPVMETLSFLHRRRHNVYFQPQVPGLSPDHPALTPVETINHTVCYDQIPQSIPVWIYEWPPFAVFLAAVMRKTALFTMRDPLARLNVMSYRDGEALNWHFDRSEFTTTLLLQNPTEGGAFQYCPDLRSDDDPNHDGVAAVLRGDETKVQTLAVEPGTLNVFKGKNTLHRVTRCKGAQARYIAVFSYFDRPGVCFSKEEQIGFYGRAA